MTKKIRLSPAQGALLGCIRTTSKRWGDLSGLRAATWQKLQSMGLLIATWDNGTTHRDGDWRLCITAQGKEAYDNE